MNHKKITLDTERKSFESIIAMQGDNKSRYIDATIVNRSIPVDLTGCTVKFSAIKPDLTDIFNNVTITDAKGGKVQIELTNQTLAKEGVIQATLVILKEDMQLSVLPFFITVIENPYNPNAIESKSEYKALNNALTVVDGYAKELQDASVNLEEKYTTRLNNFGSQLDTCAKKDDVTRISSGTPLFAENIEGMTDITKNYVNTTDGFLYRYNGVTFEATTVKYQSTGISDKSITEQKIVGIRPFDYINSCVDGFYTKFKIEDLKASNLTLELVNEDITLKKGVFNNIGFANALFDNNIEEFIFTMNNSECWINILGDVTNYVCIGLGVNESGTM
ncbi:BppU family phage baseplate upper protein [Clostridioides difficile]